MVKFCKDLTRSEVFQSTILLLILLVAAGMGLETVPELAESYADFFLYLFYFTQVAFVVEILVRIGAYGPHYARFFKESWNLFDFGIVTLSLFPGVGAFAFVVRLLRVLRVLRLFSASERLRSFMDRLRESFDEVGMAAIVVAVLGYIFAIGGYYLFGEMDPVRWGGLGRSILSVFYLALLQDVREYVSPLTAACKPSVIFFLVFYLVWASVLVGVVTASVRQGKR
ncbi:MAG: ion transporter [Bacteriovoracia bacterium]